MTRDVPPGVVHGPNTDDLTEDRRCAYRCRCDSALRWVSRTDGSAREKAFRRMNLDYVALFGDYARSTPTA
jgi:hypothetical protein